MSYHLDFTTVIINSSCDCYLLSIKYYLLLACWKKLQRCMHRIQLRTSWLLGNRVVYTLWLSLPHHHHNLITPFPVRVCRDFMTPHATILSCFFCFIHFYGRFHTCSLVKDTLTKSSLE